MTQNAILKTNETANIAELTLWGSMVVAIAESIFHFILVYGFSDGEFYFFWTGALTMSIVGAVTSFLIAFQKKTKRTGTLIVMIIIFLILFKAILYMLPAIQR